MNTDDRFDRTITATNADGVVAAYYPRRSDYPTLITQLTTILQELKEYSEPVGYDYGYPAVLQLAKQGLKLIEESKR